MISDETIKDLKGYTHSLVVEEMNLGNLIENAVKEMAAQEAKEEDEDVEDELNLEEIEEYFDSNKIYNPSDEFPVSAKESTSNFIIVKSNKLKLLL